MDVELLLDHPKPLPGVPVRLRALLTITGRTRTTPRRAGLSLGLVLDRSGSMHGEKLHYAREAAALLVRRLQPEDRVGVVSFDDRVETLAAGATGEAHREAIRQITGLQPGGTTNLSGGWLKGRLLVEDARAEEGVNRVILMTDGLANEGIVDPVALRELCRQAADAGISTTTIGFGQGFNEDLLQSMADAGGGASYYIENADQAPGIFAEEIEGLLDLAAQNVTVELRPGAGVRLAAVRHGYPATRGEEAIRLEIGDLYAREPRQLLVELLVDDPEPDVESDVCALEIRADVLTEEGGVEHRSVVLPVRLDVWAGPRVQPEVRKVATLLDATAARRNALDLDASGRAEEAAGVLDEAADRLEGTAPDDPEIVREAKDLRSLAEGMRDARRFAERDVKYMKQQMYDNLRSRGRAKERYRR